MMHENREVKANQRLKDCVEANASYHFPLMTGKQSFHQAQASVLWLCNGDRRLYREVKADLMKHPKASAEQWCLPGEFPVGLDSEESALGFALVSGELQTKKGKSDEMMVHVTVRKVVLTNVQAEVERSDLLARGVMMAVAERVKHAIRLIGELSCLNVDVVVNDPAPIGQEFQAFLQTEEAHMALAGHLDCTVGMTVHDGARMH